jgi:hypothetical protein
MSSTTTGSTEVCQARIGREFVAQLHADADVLGPHARTDVVKVALALLHRSAAEQRLAHSVDEFYGDDSCRCPSGSCRLRTTQPRAPRCLTRHPAPVATPEPLRGEGWTCGSLLSASTLSWCSASTRSTCLAVTSRSFRSPVARGRFRRRSGLLVSGELALEDRPRVYLACSPVRLASSLLIDLRSWRQVSDVRH